MTVAELIDLLNKENPNNHVLVEIADFWYDTQWRDMPITGKSSRSNENNLFLKFESNDI